MTVEIKHRRSGEVICSSDTLVDAVKKNRSNLRGADLQHADLRGADLQHADLQDANLQHADLQDANLRGADLRGANLQDADLRYANLRGANLLGANLLGARIAWQSHDLLAELLRRAAGEDIEKLKVAGLLLVCRGKCWDHFAALAANDPLGEWALDALAAWVQKDDGAPEIVARRAKGSSTPTEETHAQENDA